MIVEAPPCAGVSYRTTDECRRARPTGGRPICIKPVLKPRRDGGAETVAVCAAVIEHKVDVPEAQAARLVRDAGRGLHELWYKLVRMRQQSPHA